MHALLRRFALLGSIVIVAILGLPAGGAYAEGSDGHTIVVHKDQSIQAAIDKAPAGGTIIVERGTYLENLSITTDHITLKSKGGLGSVVLKPGQSPSPNACTPPGGPVSGICVAGQFTIDPTTGQPVLGTPVTGTRINGFVLDGFPDFGVILLNANDSTVSNSEAKNNKSYGISGFVMSGVRFLHNIAHDNGEPGFYIGDSPNAKALLVGNRASRNGVGGGEGFGFLFRDSSHGIVRENTASDNCAGYVFADTGENPVPASDWRVEENSARHNNGSCVGEPGGAPPTSGIGFGLLGTYKVTLEENTARDNQPSGPSVASGGIVLLSSKAFGGADPTDNLIEENKAFGNSPFDINYDGSGTGNRFEDNRCRTSQPPGLCQSGHDD